MAKAGRPTLPATIVEGGETDPQALARASQAATELVALEARREDEIVKLAITLGYEGTLSIGTLEDEIRFYQRRTVEALLETGKRLLLLKEMAPHGEFGKRVEMLGFSDRTAQRFMQAAAKTAKSANLAHLSTQVKSASAFLELVTHDDDTLENLAGMDDIDRMSASELRAALREAKDSMDAKDRVIADTSEKNNELLEKLKKPYKPKKGGIARTAEDEAALAELVNATNDADVSLARLGVVVTDLQEHDSEAMRDRALQSMQYLVLRLREIILANGLEVTLDEDAIGTRPAWLDGE